MESIRLQNWDYGLNAMYFVTICTHHRTCYFGEIANGKMILSAIGKIAQTEWIKTFEMRSDMNLQMGEYVVMPNHFHADFAWQSRFYDHIIRNEKSFKRIRKYICQNPSKWKNDKIYGIP